MVIADCRAQRQARLGTKTTDLEPMDVFQVKLVSHMSTGIRGNHLYKRSKFSWAIRLASPSNARIPESLFPVACTMLGKVSKFAWGDRLSDITMLVADWLSGDPKWR